MVEGSHIIVPVALGITTGSIIAYARFLWRCAQPIKHWSEDFTDETRFGDCPWLIATYAPVDFERVATDGKLFAGGVGSKAARRGSRGIQVQGIQFCNNSTHSTGGETVPLEVK